jgi:tripartite-type tricarboxylate transporter receptor subunit TctC
LFGVVLATGLAAFDGHAQSGTYPDRPVKMLVGFAAGGGTDVAARIMAQKLTDALGQSVVVENRPGASGMIAAEAVAKAVSIDTHAAHLMVHGTLHLLGYDHGDDAQAADMEAREVRALARIGIGDPYALKVTA